METKGAKEEVFCVLYFAAEHGDHYKNVKLHFFLNLSKSKFWKT